MIKPVTSILLSAMMAMSGFAVAQTSNIKSGTDGGAGPTGSSGMGDNGKSVRSRAAVKAEGVTSHNKSGTQGGEGPNADANANTDQKARMGSGSDNRVSLKSRAAVKAEGATSHNKSGTQGGEGPSPDANPGTANTGRK